MLARDAMTEDPVYIRSDRSLREAEHLFREYDMRHLPVLDDDGTLLGMLSDRDLRSYIPWDGQFGVPDLEAIEKRGDPVSAAMQSHPIYVRPDSDLREIIDLMVEWRVGAVPVLAQGDDSLVGIVSYVDVLKRARQALA